MLVVMLVLVLVLAGCGDVPLPHAASNAVRTATRAAPAARFDAVVFMLRFCAHARRADQGPKTGIP